MDLINKIKKIKYISGIIFFLVVMSIIAIPIVIIMFFINNAGMGGTDVSSLDKIAFKSMVSQNTCRNPQGVVMAAEWLYSVAGTQADGTRPEYYLEYAISNGHGKSLAYGWDPRWEQMIHGYYNPYSGKTYDQREGLDCSGFVRWAFWNAGFTEAKGTEDPKYTINANGTVARWGIKRVPASTAQPGDYAWKEGHIGIVVEVNENGAYVIESQGHDYDLRRNFYPFAQVEAGRHGFTGFYYSTMYDLGDSSCNWNMPSIYAESSILVNVNGKQMTLEEYILGSITHELDYNANINAETLKAQAVASRSYLLSHAFAGDRKNDVDLSVIKDSSGKYKIIVNVYDTSANFQRYDDPSLTIGDNEITRLVNDVINPTAGKVMLYNDNIVSTEYSTCSKDDKRYKLPTKTEIPILFTPENIQKANDMKANGELSGQYDAYWTSRGCAHSRGMEQAGAVLMSLINGWTYYDILTYYYDGSLVNINDWLETRMDSIIAKYYTEE